jgi:2-polyprenyl-3-methyl-5-hydroxy-6-metoxy-1,4-benzoquinol methylase
MDDPAIDPREHARALRSLALLNRVSRVAWGYWRRIAPLAERSRRPLRCLDVATGSADVVVALASLARRRGVTLELWACDVSPTALSQADANARLAGIELRLFRADAVRDALPTGFDVVTCSLFLHHLDDEPAETVLRRLASATGSLLVVSDLRRTLIGLGLAWAASRVFSRSTVVHTDAVLSVRGAYTIVELAAVASRAGLVGATVRPVWPQRMLLEWSRR